MQRFADDHERLVASAINSYSAIQSGRVAVTGATGTLLIHTLTELRWLLGQALPEIHLASATTAMATH